MNLIKRLLGQTRTRATFLLVLFSFVFMVSSATPALAYESTPADEENSLTRYFLDIYRPAIQAPEMNLESFVNETLKAIIFGFPLYLLNRTPFGCIITTVIDLATDGGGISTIDIGIEIIQATLLDNGCQWAATLLGQNPTEPALASAETLQITNAVGQLLAGPSISLRDPLISLTQKMGLTQPAWAQTNTFGYSAMSGIIDYWKAFRNAAYALSAVILALAGFAIMFRVKISPQMIVTIENTIPKAAVAIILVTFSYAIAGFILDLTWVVTLIVYNLLSVAGFFGAATNDIRNGLVSQGAIGFILSAGGLAGLITSMLGVADLLSAMFGAVGGFLLSGGGLILFLLFLILGIVVFIAMIKIVFNLIKAYITFLIFTVFGPIMIIAGILPGVSGFGGWLKTLISYAIVFPATAIILMIGIGFMLSPGFRDETFILMLGNITAANIIGVGGLFMVLSCASIVKNLQETVKRQMRLETAGAAWAQGQLASAQRTLQGGVRMGTSYGKQVIFDRNLAAMGDRQGAGQQPTRIQTVVNRLGGSMGIRPSNSPTAPGNPPAHRDPQA